MAWLGLGGRQLPGEGQRGRPHGGQGAGGRGGQSNQVTTETPGWAGAGDGGEAGCGGRKQQEAEHASQRPVVSLLRRPQGAPWGGPGEGRLERGPGAETQRKPARGPSQGRGVPQPHRGHHGLASKGRNKRR